VIVGRSAKRSNRRSKSTSLLHNISAWAPPAIIQHRLHVTCLGFYHYKQGYEGEKSRLEKVVNNKYSLRIAEIYGKMSKRLGRDIKGGLWWCVD
jgi:hypothetical protein